MLRGLEQDSFLIGTMFGLILASATVAGAAWVALRIKGD